MSVELEHNQISSARFSFNFESHETEPQDFYTSKDRYMEEMREIFAPGEMNVFVLEDAEYIAIKPTGLIRPINAVTSYYDYVARANAEMEKRRVGFKKSHKYQYWFDRVKQKTENGEFPSSLNSVSQMQAIDELNSEGYGIGILREKGIVHTDRDRAFIDFTLPLQLEDFKTEVLRLIQRNRERDLILLKQIQELVQGNSNQLMNFYIQRGTAHSSIVEILPQNLRTGIYFAASELLYDTTPKEFVEMKLEAGQDPSEEEWVEAHKYYSEA